MFASVLLSAQNWCISGANWWYDHWGMFGNQIGAVHVQCAGDTVILGETVHRATASAMGYDYWADMPYQFTLGDIITRSTMDQVSYWDGGQWHLLFDLSVGVGGDWMLIGTNFADRTVEVVDTGSMIIAGEPLRYSVVSFTPPFQGLTTIAGDTIIERMGYKRLFIDPNRTVAMDGDAYDLRCYQDNEVNYMASWVTACEIPLSVAGHDLTDNSFRLYPNPGGEVLHLERMGRSPAEVLVTDVTGRTVARTVMQPGAFEINTAQWAPGLYQVRVTHAGGSVVSRWVKR